MTTPDTPLALLKDPSLLKTDALINGKWVKGKARFDVTDPATGRKLADVADLGAKETKAAIQAANTAWPAWRTQTAKQRHALLMKWFELLMDNQDDLDIPAALRALADHMQTLLTEMATEETITRLEES